MNYKALATRHKAEFDKLVEGAGQLITIRQPGTRVAGSSAVDRVKGSRTSETSVGTTNTVLAIWSNDLLTDAGKDTSIASILASIGTKETVDAIIRCKLEDVLITAGDLQGRTLFHTARDVTYSGHTYEVVGTPKRTGLPPIGPYILWVGLKQIPEES